MMTPEKIAIISFTLSALCLFVAYPITRKLYEMEKKIKELKKKGIIQ